MIEQSRSFLGVAVLAGAVGLGGSWTRWREAHPAPRAPAAPIPASGLPFSLTEEAAKAGLVNVHRKASFHPSLKNVEPMLAATAGAAVAVADVDGDGWMDVYLTNTAKGSLNKLFRNKHDGTFEELGAKAGVADVNRAGGTLSALFFDFDDDGRPDLLLRTLAGPRLYRNVGGGKFADVTAKSGLKHEGFAYAMNVLDYDGDGCLDVLFAGHFKPTDLVNGPVDPKFMPDSQVTAGNGGPTVLYRGHCDGTFSAVADKAGIEDRGFVHAVGVYDLRGTGRGDLYFASDFGPDALSLNEGGRFSDGSPAIVDKHTKSGMSAEIADLDDDGKPAVFVTNIFEPDYTIGENALWKFAGGKSFRNVARERGVDRCGWAWGAKFLDLDNDGRQDLVVANGFLSANPKKSYWYTWGVIFASRSSFIEDARNWPPLKDASLSGYQRDCVFWNRGGSFSEVAGLTGLKDDLGDGRAVAAIDLDNSGSLSLIITNSGQAARLYRNRQKNGNRWLGLKLRGTRSNRDAFGARARVTLADGRVLTRELRPANGYLSESDPRLHFGLGPAPEVKGVEILWPSGTKQALRGVPLGRYTEVIEP